MATLFRSPPDLPAFCGEGQSVWVDSAQTFGSLGLKLAGKVGIPGQAMASDDRISRAVDPELDVAVQQADDTTPQQLIRASSPYNHRPQAFPCS